MKALKPLILLFMAAVISLAASAQGAATSTSTKTSSQSKAVSKSSKGPAKAGIKNTKPVGKNKAAGGSSR